MTLETALLAALGALTTVISILWIKINGYMEECRAERTRCEKDLRDIWQHMSDRGDYVPKEKLVQR